MRGSGEVSRQDELALDQLHQRRLAVVQNAARDIQNSTANVVGDVAAAVLRSAVPGEAPSVISVRMAGTIESASVWRRAVVCRSPLCSVSLCWTSFPVDTTLSCIRYVCLRQVPSVSLAAARVGVGAGSASTEVAPGIGVNFSPAGLGTLPPGTSSVDM